MRLLAVALVGCSGAVPPGSPDSPLDLDQDGWSQLDGDCDDDAASVNPDAADIPGDGLDQDCDGVDAAILIARGLSTGDLLITEVHKAPIGVGPAAGEWFEVQNALGVPVDLLGLELRGEVGDAGVVDVSLVVEPGARVVLGTTADMELNGGVSLDHAYGTDLRLGNTEGRLELAVGFVSIFALEWDPAFPDVDGRAMQLSAGALDPLTAMSWCSAEGVYGIGGYGTPGAANTVCPGAPGVPGLVDAQPGDLVITEIMKDPVAVDGAFGEWVEIRNASARDLDLFGLELVDDNGDGVQLDEHRVLASGDYAILAASADPSANGGLLDVWLEWGEDFSLRNSDDHVRVRFGTLEFDVVAYDNGETFPDLVGAAMGTPPDTDADANDAGSEWCEASVPYGLGDLGTPGAPNPPC